VKKKKKGDIVIKGARVHNLKDVTVSIPRNKLTVITGLSGSGKSSLAFDTLYAEGQRRYVESLSSYARQFLGKLDKPDVDAIEGIAPAIAIEQKVISRNSRSTVGTSTEIYDYLKLLFARIGRTISPESGQEVKRDQVSDVINYTATLPAEMRLIISAPIELSEERSWEQAIKLFEDQGFARVRVDGKVMRISEALALEEVKELELVVDRFTADQSEENLGRMGDSFETAFFEGKGRLRIEVMKEGGTETKEFSNLFEADGMSFEKPSVHFFSFNNPIGACKVCEGFGSVIGIDPDLVIPDHKKSVFDDAVVAWKGEKMSKWKNDLVMAAEKSNFPVHRPIKDLTKKEYDLLWNGSKQIKGINDFFSYVESKAYKIQYRVMLSRYRGKTKCPDCNGSRLRKDAEYVKVGEVSISEIVNMPVERAYEFFKKLKVNEHEAEVAKRILIEITSRLEYLVKVGLGYLTLSRMSNTLSGGESQRINLATSLGSSLVGSMYILDEPSIGLHTHDTERLIEVLMKLRDLGNSVIVVEHDEDIISAADHVIDMGPEAGMNGGELIFSGTLSDLKKSPDGLTSDYMNLRKSIVIPPKRRKIKSWIELKGVSENNLNKVDINIPLGVLASVTGVSGSGKTSLIRGVLFPALSRHLGVVTPTVGEYDALDGALDTVASVEMVDQNPIGRSSRSNPVTYIKAYDEIRALFSDQQIAVARGYKPAFFSFNVQGGRCDSCDGEGSVKIGMQFMADISLECESCHGKRFKEEILEVKYKDKSIADVLDMTVAQAIDFFSGEEKGSAKKIREKLLPLDEVGLGYVKLGQSSSTLSGGEAQRIKLAFFLGKRSTSEKTLFIFDEPTTGLHFHDVQKLLIALNALVDMGHSVITIEHNMDIIKSADWVIDLGPGGGEHGGKVVFEGTPEDMVSHKKSLTAKYLKLKMKLESSIS
jgi:excinuclease ABC subunit A